MKSEGLPDSTPHFADGERLKKRICVGQYHFDQKEATISVKYAAVDGEYRLTLLLRHSKACSAPRIAFERAYKGAERGIFKCEDSLRWEQYEMEDQVRGEVIPFNLGRLPDWSLRQ